MREQVESSGMRYGKEKTSGVMAQTEDSLGHTERKTDNPRAHQKNLQDGRRLQRSVGGMLQDTHRAWGHAERGMEGLRRIQAQTKSLDAYPRGCDACCGAWGGWQAVVCKHPWLHANPSSQHHSCWPGPRPWMYPGHLGVLRANPGAAWGPQASMAMQGKSLAAL